MTWLAQEHASLVQTFRDSEPTAPTLCTGWDVRRLLAHMTQREQQPLARISDVLSRQPPGQEPALSRLTDPARTAQGYTALVDCFSRGAPAWSPMRWAGDRLNSLEYVVHHEDIRRAGDHPAEPRDLPPEQQDGIWDQLGLFAKLGLRKAPVGLRLSTPGGQSRVVRAGDGVTLTGEPVELALWVLGRREAARVSLSGPSEALASMRAWAQRSD